MARWVRTTNVVVEVFIDVAEDGRVQAEAVMLREPDMGLMAQGSASLEAHDLRGQGDDEGKIAAYALADLIDSLLRDPAEAGEVGGAPAPPDGPGPAPPGSP